MRVVLAAPPFVENRERRLLRNIERTMKPTIPEVERPNAELLGKCCRENSPLKYSSSWKAAIGINTAHRQQNSADC
ncbi:hypothetical protein ACNKHP_10145 [Shigella boydii]